MKNFLIGLFIILLSGQIWANTREDNARTIVEGINVDAWFAARYVIWDDHERQLIGRELAQEPAKGKKNQRKRESNWVQLANGLPQHDKYYAEQYKQMLTQTLLNNFNDDELAELTQGINSPVVRKMITMKFDLDAQFAQRQADDVVNRITGQPPTQTPDYCLEK